MANQKPLITSNGTTQQIPNTDTLLAGVAIEPSTGTALRIGTAGGTTTTTFPGPVRLDGDVTTVGGTTFTTDATFEGNVTFGNGPADTVTFAATTTVVSDINMGGGSPTYTIANVIDPTNAQDVATKAYVDAQVSGGGMAIGGAITGATQGSVLFAGAAGVLAQDNTNFFWDDANNRLGIGTASPNEALTVSGALSLAEGTAPSATANFGKFYALSSDSRPYFLDDGGQAFNLTLDRFNTLTPAASVAIDTSPALPVFNSLALNQNTTFTTSNLGNGRSASVRVVGDASTRTLTWPAGWTWLGSGPPADLAANDVGYLSLTAYGATDADVVAAWSYENMPAAVTGSGVATRVAFWNGTSALSSDANLYWDDTNNRLGVGTATPTTTLDVRGTVLAKNTANSTTAFQVQNAAGTTVLDVDTTNARVGIGTSAPSYALEVAPSANDGANVIVASATATDRPLMTLTRVRGTVASPTGVQSGDILGDFGWAGATSAPALSGSAKIRSTATENWAFGAVGSDIRFLTTANGAANATEAMRIANDGRVSVGTTGSTHTFNIGTGASANFCVASGGRIHTYDGTAPTNGQVLIGDTALGNFAKATLTAGSGISITNGAGSITISATGGGGGGSLNPVRSADLGPSGLNTRVFGTNYQNTTGVAIWVQLNGIMASGSGAVEAYVDATAVPTTRVFSQSSPSLYAYTTSFYVPAGSYYRVPATAGTTIREWFEYQLLGSGNTPITTISTTTTLDATYYTVLCSATLTVNLPAAASNTGRVYNIKNTGAAATITIDPNASETIDGATTYTLTTQYESITIQCDGSNWFIL